MPDDISLMDKLCTVFRDVDRRDIGKKMWLVCRVYRLGLLNPPAAGKSGAGGGNLGAAGMMGGGGNVVKQEKLQNIADDEPIFRRNYGVGAAELSELEMHSIESGKRVELTMQLFTPPSSMGGEKGEFGFPYLHFMLMSQGNPTDPDQQIHQCSGVALSLAMYDGNLDTLESEGKGPFVSAPDLTVTKRGLLQGEDEDLDPTEERNDLFVTVSSGKFSQDRKKQAKNIEVKVTCLLDSGSPVECLSRGVGEQTVPSASYRSAVYYHKNDPAFNETIRLSIPNDKFERCHLLFVVSHTKDDKDGGGVVFKSSTGAYRNPSSFAFFPLTSSDNGAAYPDGTHKLKCYELLAGMSGEKGAGERFNPMYLQDVTKLTERNITNRIGVLTGASGNSSGPMEELVVKTLLMSTKKTQIKSLHELINWRQLDPPAVQTMLREVPKQEFKDILNVMREVLDATIALLNAKSSSKREILKPFHFFSWLLDQFNHKKHTAYRAALIAYAQRPSNSLKKLHTIILGCLKQYLTWITEDDGAGDYTDPAMRSGLLKTLSSLHFQMVFLAASYAEVKTTADAKSHEDFVREVTNVLDMVITLMRQEEPRWIRQRAADTVKQLWPSMVTLKEIIPLEVQAAKAAEMIEALAEGTSLVGTNLVCVCISHRREHTTPTLTNPTLATVGVGIVDFNFTMEKLAFVKKVVTGHIFDDRSARFMLIPKVLNVLKGSLEKDGEERELAVVVVNDLLHQVQAHKDGAEAAEMLYDLLPLLVTAVDNTMEEADEIEEEGDEDEDEEALQVVYKYATY